MEGAHVGVPAEMEGEETRTSVERKLDSCSGYVFCAHAHHQSHKKRRTKYLNTLLEGREGAGQKNRKLSGIFNSVLVDYTYYVAYVVGYDIKI